MFRRGLFYAYLTIYLRHYLGLSVTATTLFATLPMLVNVLSQTFIWGRVSDHFQLRRSLMITGEVTAAIGTVAVWYLHRLPDDPRLAGYIIILGLTSWMGLARIVRSNVLSLKETEFVLAARALGLPNRNIIWSHILPNTLASIIVALALPL